MHWFWCPTCRDLVRCQLPRCMNRPTDHPLVVTNDPTDTQTGQPTGTAFCQGHGARVSTDLLGRNLR